MKVLSIVTALSLFVLLIPMHVWAQPFGIGSKQQVQRPQHDLLCSHNGRFVFGQISDSGKDQFMLDTNTGRLWRVSESGKIGMFLEPVLYHTGEKEYLPVPKDTPNCPHRVIEKQKKKAIERQEQK